MSGMCILFTLAATLVTLLKLIFGMVFWTNFLKLITTTLDLCFSDTLRSWWFQGIAEKAVKKLKEEAILRGAMCSLG